MDAIMKALEMVPWLTLLWALPLAAGLGIQRLGNPDQARRAGAVIAAVMVLVSLGLTFAPGPGLRLEEVIAGVGALHYHMGIDGLNAPMTVLTSMILLGVTLGAPRAALNPQAIGALLMRSGAIMGCFLTLDALWLLAFWVLALLPGQITDSSPDTQGAIRMYRIYVKGGVLPLALAVGALGWVGWQAGLTAPFDIAQLTHIGISSAWQMAIFLLLTVAVMMRMGIAPLHAWLPAFSQRGSMGVVALVIGTHMGLFLVVRLMLPLLPEASALGMPILADVALLSALYGAVLALGQRDLRRIIGCITISQRSLMLVGLASLNVQSISGAMLQFLGTGGAVVGLLLVVWALQARIGTTEVPRYAGLVRQAPGLAAMFLLFTIASVGFPGSLGFVAEDLLIHGVIDAHPIVAGLLLIAMALNGITLMRAFMQTFFGDSERAYSHVHDLLPRERIVSGVLLVLLLIGGWFPQTLLSQWEHQVNALAARYTTPTAAHAAHAQADDATPTADAATAVTPAGVTPPAAAAALAQAHTP
jgi:NADH-quinone oxidoreductase subunit M